MAERWTPKSVDFTITGKDADELAAASNPEEWLQAYFRKKYHLPESAKIDLSGLNITAAKKPGEKQE